MTEPRVDILSETACELGEGPSYDPAADTLWWFDITGRKMFEHRFADGSETVHDLPVMASAVAVVDDTRQLLATDVGLQLRDIASGRLEMVTAIEADNPVTRSNDARVHPSGSFWIGTMGRNAEDRAGAIYLYRGGETKRLFADVSIPNSICFSPAGDIAYFADTARNKLFRVACDPGTGLPTEEPTVFLDHRGQPGGIDGSVNDADGNIWNARWGSGRIDMYDPQGCKQRSVAMPATQSSCPAFVGANAGRIAVTSALQGMDQAARAADPHAGKTFIVGLDVNGRLEPKARL